MYYVVYVARGPILNSNNSMEYLTLTLSTISD